MKALVNYLAKEKDIPKEMARLILTKRAKRRYDRPGAFKYEKIFLGGNGNGNHKQAQITRKHNQCFKQELHTC